jgi:hypothetical protein
MLYLLYVSKSNSDFEWLSQTGTLWVDVSPLFKHEQWVGSLSHMGDTLFSKPYFSYETITH